MGSKNFRRRSVASRSTGKPVDGLTAPSASWNGVIASAFKGFWAGILFRRRRQKLRRRMRKIKNNRIPIMQPTMSAVGGDEDDERP